MVEEDDTGDCQTDPETDTIHDSDEDTDVAPPRQLEEDFREGPMRGISRPKARPLKDPL